MFSLPVLLSIVVVAMVAKVAVYGKEGRYILCRMELSSGMDSFKSTTLYWGDSLAALTRLAEKDRRGFKGTDGASVTYDVTDTDICAHHTLALST